MSCRDYYVKLRGRLLELSLTCVCVPMSWITLCLASVAMSVARCNRVVPMAAWCVELRSRRSIRSSTRMQGRYMGSVGVG